MNDAAASASRAQSASNLLLVACDTWRHLQGLRDYSLGSKRKGIRLSKDSNRTTIAYVWIYHTLKDRRYTDDEPFARLQLLVEMLRYLEEITREGYCRKRKQTACGNSVGAHR